MKTELRELVDVLTAIGVCIAGVVKIKEPSGLILIVMAAVLMQLADIAKEVRRGKDERSRDNRVE